MKFTGIVASLAIASTASAAALPAVPVDAAVSKLTMVLGNLDTVVGGLLGNTLATSDLGGLTQIQSELTGIKSALGQCTGGVVSRDVLGNVAEPVKATAETAVGTVEGAVTTATGAIGVRALDQVTGLAGNIVQQVQSGALDEAGLANILSLVQGGELTSALGLLNIL
ncbi:hypothetical protein FE257_012444 [Aspergillus nanangensis]|uniref:Uncharacterized protein n=1 Tax=Aspergillus nanangensis TaxID=2582783 RepID=A0AAD4CV47_ASPNN|nr:hypothetical protein FE257_012444 [Aspergillus nanangensis]